MRKNTIQHFLTQCFDKYHRSHGMPLYQIEACSRLMKCRTEALGGHAVYCENDHLNGVWYNSCKHRSCPQCQALRTEHWLEKTGSVLLNCPHHHWIFTLPHELHEIWNFNRIFCFTLFFKAISDTIKKLSSDNKHLGAQPGYLLAFHSWARNLVFHPHIHCLISHGGLDNKSQWRTPKRNCFLPAKVLMAIFRGKYLAGIKAAIKNNTLKYPKNMNGQKVLNLCNKWGRKAWVVHCVTAYGEGRNVAKYLARYIRGGAVRNSQIIKVTDENIRFRYKSHQTQKTEYLTLTHDNFMQRLVSHMALPRKKQCQMYGLYHHCCRKKLDQARVNLGQEEYKKEEDLSWQEFLARKNKKSVCERCGELLVKLRDIRELEEDERYELLSL